MNYDNDYAWSQWNTTGKIRILMESNAAPPMAQYSIETKPSGSGATQLSSLASRTSNYARPGMPVQRPTEQAAQPARNITHLDPIQVSLTEYSEDALPPASQDSEATVEIFQDLDDMNKENDLGFNCVVWNGIVKNKRMIQEKKAKQKVRHNGGREESS